MHIIAAVQPVFLYPPFDQMMGFGQVYSLQMLQHLFAYYGSIDEIALKENVVKMIGTNYPADPLACLINQS